MNKTLTVGKLRELISGLSDETRIVVPSLREPDTLSTARYASLRVMVEDVEINVEHGQVEEFASKTRTENILGRFQGIRWFPLAGAMSGRCVCLLEKEAIKFSDEVVVIVDCLETFERWCGELPPFDRVHDEEPQQK